VASFGARLKQERERRKISLDEISASTKISARLLRALEEDHFELLPGGIFNKGFIRAYAQHLGLDEEQMVAEYIEASGILPADGKSDESVAASVGEIRAESYSDDNASLPWGLFAIVLLIVALAFAMWGFHAREKANRDNLRSALHPDAASASPTPFTPAPPSDSKLPPVRAGAEPAHPAMTPVSTAPNPDSSARVRGGGSGSIPPAGAILVRITLRQDAWLSITADGKRILQDTLSAPAEKSVQAAKEITVKTGNIGALDFEWNGKKLPPQGNEGGVMTLSFDANGWHTVAKAAPAPAPANPF
jgi:cytoskeleton protein RodZ